jgi:hypothetical protein
MDSAERARRADTPSPAMPQLALPTLELPTPQLSPPQLRPSETVGSSPRQHGSPAVPVRTTPGSLPSSFYDSGAEKTVIVRLEPAKPRIVLKLLITMLVATVVAYAGILWQNHRPGTAETPAPSVVPPTAPAPAAAASAEASEESAESGGAPAHGPVVEPIVNNGPGEKVPLLGKAAKNVVANRAIAARKTKGPAKAQGSAQSRAAKPDAPQSPAAQGYVALNHRQPSRAIALFKKALASNPSNGTALFGLAEAYRNGGQTAPALQSYRKYVELLPSGPDAGRALHQIRILESKKR